MLPSALNFLLISFPVVVYSNLLTAINVLGTEYFGSICFMFSCSDSFTLPIYLFVPIVA